MKLALILRSVVASVCVSAAGIFACALPAVVLFKGATPEADIRSFVLVGVPIAIALTVVGYGVAGRVREAIPGAVALLVLGAIAQPFASALSTTVKNGNWLSATMLAIAPFLVNFAAIAIRNSMFGSDGAKDAA
jgi:hypothetical protein